MPVRKSSSPKLPVGGELYGFINIAEINDDLITHEQAQYLRDKNLWGKGV